MLKIALAQMEVIPGHPDKNAAKMLQLIDKAKNEQAQMIIFPEMSVSGYFLGDTWENDAFVADCEAYGQEIIAAAQGIVVMFGNIAVDWSKKNNDGRTRKYNAFFTATGGKAVYPDNMPYPFSVKTLMPNYREFDDTRHFFSLQKLARELGTTPDRLISPVTLKINGRRYRIGCLLCEDGWSDNYELTPLLLLKRQQPIDFFVNISSSPYTLGKNEKRHRLFAAEAREVNAPLIYVNNTGIQNNGKTVYTFDGGSTVYAADGRIATECAPYDEVMPLVDIDNLPTETAASAQNLSDIGHIHQALIYGIRHFLTTIKLHKVVVGVSGGIDSAVAATLYTEVLGADNVLLINMPSRFNSATTQNLSATLAQNLGCRYAVMPIEQSVIHTMEQLTTTAIKIPGRNEPEHLTIKPPVAENIQARDRGSRILAAAAAAFGGGFTCNANKAELTVGYSTLYGDQAGFLAALADLWKYQVYDLARYLNEQIWQREVIPQGIIDIVPSAELSAAQNVDEGKGDPLRYPYHDYLFRAFVERWQKAAPEDILTWYGEGRLAAEIGCAPDIIEQTFPSAAEFVADLERWWNLFTGMAVAKRIQAPPILAVSRRAYGFDHREAQNGAYYTRRYLELKARLTGDGT